MSQPQSPTPGGAAGSAPGAAAPQSKRIGTTIADRYKVISLLNKDDAGETYLVEHSLMRKQMALKVIGTELLPTPELVARFEREMLVTAPLEHPNIVAPTDVGRTKDGASYLVFEHIAAKSLRELLAAGPMPPSRVLQIARQVASALAGAHSVNCVHRDLTPEKILLRQREGEVDQVKILDFGLAQIRTEALLPSKWDASRSQAPTRHATTFGTPRYMAPEQSVGGEIDGRTDLYSLGVIVYELLTGAPPFPGEDPAELLKQHVIGKVPTLAERAPGLRIAAEFERLVMQLLAKSPQERPATARMVLDAIDQILAPEQPGAALAPPDKPAEPDGASLAMALADLVPATPAAASEAIARPAASSPGGEGEPASPLAAAMRSGNNAPLPKLRAPSVIDLAILQPDAANPAVLAPAPPPSASERVLDGSKEVARLGREVVWPAVKQRGGHALAWVRTELPRLWNQTLDRIRPRLPPKLRGVSQTALGLMVGGLMALVILSLFIAIWPSSEPAKRRTPVKTAMPGFASEREMEQGVEQGPPALVALVAKYPKDARCHRALVRAYAAKKNYVEALRALVPLLQLDPSAQSDEAMSQVVAEAVFVSEISESALAFLETAMGPHGIDVLLDLADKTPTEPWATRLGQSLAKDSVRKLASPEALLLLDLRAAGRCEQKKALLPRAAQQGGARVQKYLRGLQSTVGCGTGGKADCWSCLRKNSALQNAITAIDQRGGVAP